MKTMLITGGSGALGNDAIKYFKEKGFTILAPSSSVVDITNFNIVSNYFKNNSNIDIILHCAAYTNVDKAENDIFNTFLINHYGTLNLATMSNNFNLPIIYISTDYVFDGNKKSPYLINDIPNPLNIYGKSKLAGEKIVQKLCKKFYIVRTSWLYGLTGTNFVNTILNLSNTKTELSVVNDQIGCPTFTYDLIEAIYTLISNNKPYGIYHGCSSGETSWYNFAKQILFLANRDTKVLPVKTEFYNNIAQRPKYSVMYNNNLCNNWLTGIKKYFKFKENYKENL